MKSVAKVMNFRRFNKILGTAKFSTTKFPLEGVRILDLSRIIAGPYCSMILGDLGADVIKVERPGAGDESRKWGPPFLKNSADSVYFLACNRNKKSICVDLKRGRDIIYELAQKCDVLLENYVPGKLDQMGLDYESVRRVAPAIIYCSVTGFGSRGPYKSRAGYDVIAASMGGLMHVTGEKSAPSKVGVAITDICTGLYAHGAILAALLHRSRTGEGQRIEVDLLSTQIACLINLGVNFLNANIEAGRYGTEHVSIVPYASYETKDGFFTIGTGSDKQFAELCTLMGLGHLSRDAKYSSNSRRVENRDELTSILRREFKSEENSFWSKKFENASFPFGPVNSMRAVFEDEHVKEIGIVKTLRHKEAGDVRVVGPNVVYSKTEVSARQAPPVLGEHTDEVLTSILGYDDEKIERLRREKVIQ